MTGTNISTKSASPQRARIQMLQRSNLAFFANLAMRLEPREAAGMGTVGTDGISFFYDPEVWASWTLEEQIGAWVHEVMHVASGHLFRRGDRDAHRWNCAGDYCINLVIYELGLQLPKGSLHDRQYDDMTSEAIYEYLPKAPPSSPCSWLGVGAGAPQASQSSAGDEPSDNGSGQQSAASKPSPKELEHQWQAATVQAAAFAKEIGNLPGNLERMIDGLLPAKISWRERLRHWLGTRAKTEYEFSRPNRRFAHTGMYLPSLNGQQLDIVWITDTSGSMDETILAQALAEVNALRTQVKTTLRILHVDAAVNREDYYGTHDRIPVKLAWEGGGGTNLQTAFDYLKTKAYPISGIICFTDGYTYPAPLKNPFPDMPVLWLLPEHGSNAFAKFGQFVKGSW